MFSKLRSNGCCLLFYLSIVLVFLLIFELQAMGSDARIKMLSNSNELAGPVNVSGDLIVFSQKSASSYLPVYYDIKNNEKGIINPAVSLSNNDPVKISQGVALYRSKNKDQLWISNLEQQEHWGLNKGESRVIADGAISAYFAISGNRIAYLEDNGLHKNCWLLYESGEAFIIAAHIKASNLQLYQDENYSIATWLNTDTGLINYCDLSVDSAVKSLAGSKAQAPFSLWKDRVVYCHSDNGKYYLHRIDPAAIPQQINLAAATGPLYLHDNVLFYAAGSKINAYELESDNDLQLINHLKPILCLSSNGSDLLWKDSLHYPYWRAAVRDISLSGQGNLKVGESLQIRAMASFKNNFQADVSQTSAWCSSNNGIAEVESGICTAKSAGEVTIKAVYENIYAETSFLVKSLESLEVIPNKVNLEIGDTMQFCASGIYSDASTEDMTTLVNWECSSAGTISGQGLFTAKGAGLAEVKASWGVLSASAELTIAAANSGEPPADEPNGDEASPSDNQNPDNNPSPVIEPENLSPNEDQGPALFHSHADDEAAFFYETTTQYNSPLFLALQKAPISSTVEVEVGDTSGVIEFTLEKAVFEIMSRDQKTLLIKSRICSLEFSPAFAASYYKENLKFRLNVEITDPLPVLYGACLLEPIAGIYKLTAKNDKNQAINSFAVPITLTLFKSSGKNTDNEKTGILAHKLSEQEWGYIRSTLLKGGARDFVCQFPGVFTMMDFNSNLEQLDTHWAREDMEILAAQQVFADFDQSSFIPDHSISRGEFMELLGRVLDLDLVITASAAKSAGEDEEYDPALVAALEMGIVQGDAGGGLALERKISREEMAVMVFRALPRKNISVEINSEADQKTINDREKISSWAYTEIDTLHSLEIMNGRPDNSFAPRESSTWAEAAVVLRRLMNCMNFI